LRRSRTGSGIERVPSARAQRGAPRGWDVGDGAFAARRASTSLEGTGRRARSARRTRGGTRTDHLGTPRAMYDERGSESWAAETDTYGALRDVRGTRSACPFRFPGQYEDAETGLYYNRFRYYDPEAGGYVSQDPIGLAGGTALHAYAVDPNTGIDALGLSEACGAIVPYYPPNDGFSKPPSSLVLPSGTRLDRFGGPHGRFVSPEGVPMPMRALPHDADLSQYRAYELVQPLEVQAGPIAPAFGKIGGGTQYVLPRPASQLVSENVLRVVSKP